LQTSFQTELITFTFSRPLPWTIVSAERNNAGDCHFFKIGGSFFGYIIFDRG
jgi:hypothetical protein